MKKLAFTAFAVLAFINISNANSIKQTENIGSDIVSYEDCNVWAMNFCEEINGWNGTDSATAYRVYRQVVEFCETASEVKYITIDDENDGGVIIPFQP